MFFTPAEGTATGQHQCAGDVPQCENAPCVGACPVGALTMGDRWCRPILPVVLAVRAASVRAVWDDHHSVIAGGYPATNRECDLCEQREEGPACVESCPTQRCSCLLKENSGESASSVLLQR